MEPNRLLGNRYRCTERLAIGGQGEVWHAWDTRLERDVAIKLLHPTLANDADYRQRFTLEARTVAALNEPAIVDLYDACEDTDGYNTVSYLVMEYVDGQPLSAIMRQDRLPNPGQVMRWMAQVSHGLQAAHQAGIIHRDIKPANIIIRRDGKATIIDFGIARRHGDPGLTATGKVLGTLSYASPEQLEGKDLTGASDIYSLGAVAYECLSGQRPFEGDTPGAVIAGHIGREPEELSVLVAPAITEVVMRALRKDPRERFDDASAFARAAERAADHLDSNPRSDPASPSATPPSDPPRRKRGRRGLVAATLALLLLAAGAGAFMLWPQIPSFGAEEPDEETESDDPEDEYTSITGEPPDSPPDTTRFVNVATGNCLDIGSDSEDREIVKTNDCDEHDNLYFNLQPDEGASRSYKVADEGGNCVSYSPDDGEVGVALCERINVGWTFEWVPGENGSEEWQMSVTLDSSESPNAGETLCLTDNQEEAVETTNCDNAGEESQTWRVDTG